MDTTEHLTVDQIVTSVYASMVPEGDPDDHDMLVRLSDEILRLRGALHEMASRHPFEMDGSESAMTAAWFVTEARRALGVVTTA